MHFKDLSADFKRATTFPLSRSCVPLLCVSDPELAPSKLTGHCIALCGLFHPHQLAEMCTSCCALAVCSAMLTSLCSFSV